jgi:hypothetical protein
MCFVVKSYLACKANFQLFKQKITDRILVACANRKKRMSADLLRRAGAARQGQQLQRCCWRQRFRLQPARLAGMQPPGSRLLLKRRRRDASR